MAKKASLLIAIVVIFVFLSWQVVAVNQSKSAEKVDASQFADEDHNKRPVVLADEVIQMPDTTPRSDSTDLQETDRLQTPDSTNAAGTAGSAGTPSSMPTTPESVLPAQPVVPEEPIAPIQPIEPAEPVSPVVPVVPDVPAVPEVPTPPNPPEPPKSSGGSGSSGGGQASDPDIAIVSAAKKAAEEATYTDTTQAAHGTEDSVKSYVKDLAEAAVNNHEVHISITKVRYTAPTAGDADNPPGMDGKYTFTVTVSKGAQSQTTAEKSIRVAATPFTGLSNEQAVAAAKAALVDGTIYVAFGATQDDKADAALSYVNSLLTGDAAGVSASITSIGDTGDYEVLLKKGSASDRKMISLTILESEDPDIAIVEAAKQAAQGAEYSSISQTAYPAEGDVRLHVEGLVKTAVNNNVVSIAINKVNYMVPMAGDADNPDGMDGNYIFTITVSKGVQSRTTGQLTMILLAEHYAGASNEQAVLAAKTVLVDGTVHVSFGASQAEKTAAVQTYVDNLLIGDAAGVSAVVSFNSETGKYDVALQKGSQADNTSLNMTILEAADPDIALVAAAKEAAENAAYHNTTQAAHSTETAVKDYVEALAEAAVNNSQIAIDVTTAAYAAPAAGNADNPAGTNGSYAFTITVSKGEQSQVTTQKSVVISATPFTGITNEQAIFAAKTVLVDGTVHVSFGASQIEKTVAVQIYVNALLTGDAADVMANVNYNSETGEYDVTLLKGTKMDSVSLNMTVMEAADPDIALVAAAKEAAENTAYHNTTQATHSTETAVKDYVEALAEAAVNNSQIAIDVTTAAYAAPAAGNADNPAGTNGNYLFTITVSKGEQSQVTTQKSVVISATPFTGITNEQAVFAAKAVLVDGTVHVSFGASQIEKTVAVQIYVNALLTGDAAGVSAVVSFNSETGKYDVALEKGSQTDNTSLNMTIMEAADPDIAMVAAAKAAAENAAYHNTTQAAHSTETAVKDYVGALAEAAVSNSQITVSITSMGYTAPTAGDVDNQVGADGSYAFTITVSKGAQSQTTSTKSITINATPYESPYKMATDADFLGTVNGNFKYVGLAEYVEVPHVIKGVAVTSYKGMFQDSYVIGVKSTNSNVTDMSEMFYQSRAASFELSDLDTSNVTDMSSMFSWSQATSLDLSSFNTSKVTDMSYMFSNSQATSLNLSSFNTSNVTNMKQMFYRSYATNLDLSNFDSSNVTDMQSMFNQSKATSIVLSNFNTSNVTTMSGMFNGSQATSLDLTSFNTSNVTDMYGMFYNSKATSLDLTSFNTSKVKDMMSMFQGTKIKTLDISSFDTANVTLLNGMFDNSQLKTVYIRTQADMSRLISQNFFRPADLTFIVK